MTPDSFAVSFGAFSTGAGYLTFATLVGRAGATRGAIAIYLVPVVAIALGAVFRGEHPGAIALGGAALVAGGPCWPVGAAAQHAG